MKKSFLLIFAIVALGWQGSAQEIAKNAIGIRLGEGDGFGPEINYQRAIGDNNRLEFGFAWHSRSYHDAVKLTGIYQWIWHIDDGFNWYAGPGAGLGIVSYDHYYNYYPYRKNKSSDVFGFVTGQIGIEYGFDFPLLLSFDIRPQFNFGYHDDVNIDFGVAARYQF